MTEETDILIDPSVQPEDEPMPDVPNDPVPEVPSDNDPAGEGEVKPEVEP